jgi:hypothetical protein
MNKGRRKSKMGCARMHRYPFCARAMRIGWDRRHIFKVDLPTNFRN